MNVFKKRSFLVSLLTILISPTIALAIEPSSPESGNTAWIMTSTALVLFMTLPGLSLFYGGLVRTKNVLSIFMQCFALTCIVSVLWVVYLYSFSFGTGNSFFGGFEKIFMAGLTEDSLWGDIPESVFSMFQLTFAIITPALVIGSFAERMNFLAVLIFSTLWVTFVYAPVCHWVWGGGWLGEMGLLDFAGGTVVHVTAGIASLVTALVLGPRKGFPSAAMMPHNMTMVVTGAGMLWVGWFGFNGGSALAANGDAGMAIMVTHISAAAASLTWMAREWKKFGKPSVLGIVTGMVAGLGTITPASGFVGPGGALVIGIVAGAVCFSMTSYIKVVLKIDDSLDVFPVHGVGGIMGTLMAGVFCSTGLGVFSGQGFADGVTSIAQQVGIQFTGVLATAVYTAILTWVILKITEKITPLRVTSDEEVEGLDIAQHEERGYNY